MCAHSVVVVKASSTSSPVPASPEELHVFEQELYIYFPNGMARPKLSMAAVERALLVSGSARNWNSVVKLLEMAERLEAGK